jgi:hypothetical protein
MAAGSRHRRRVPVVITAVLGALGLFTLLVIALMVSMRSTTPPSLALLIPTPTSTIPAVNPQQLLDNAASAMSSLRTLRYVSDVGIYGLTTPTSTVTETAFVSMTLHGGVAFPDSYTLDGDSVPVGQYIVQGETTWSRRNGNPGWVRQQTSEVNIGAMNPLLPVQFPRYYKPGTVRQVEVERRENGNLRHLQFEVDVPRMLAEIPQAARDLSSGWVITADTWVRDNDHILDRVYTVVDTRTGITTRTNMLLTGYNEPVDIKAP